MKSAINRVGDKFGLPNSWLNTDFMHTASYSDKLPQYSKYHRTFSNVLTIRTVSAEYLIAMKLKAARKYKHDLSDIVGILAEHEKRGEPISLDAVVTAVTNLYGDWNSVSEEAATFIEDVYRNGNFADLYETIKIEEQESKQTLINFQKTYPGVTTADNVGDILESLRARTKQ